MFYSTIQYKNKIFINTLSSVKYNNNNNNIDELSLKIIFNKTPLTMLRNITK